MPEIVFLKSHGSFKKGNVIDTDPPTAANLIKDGIAQKNDGSPLPDETVEKQKTTAPKPKKENAML